MNFETKQCPQCERTYAPSSRHRLCPSCRAKNLKHPCIDCGSLVGYKYLRCVTCHNRNNAKNAKGQKSTNWKGRKYYKKGYVMVIAPNDHPRIKNQVGCRIFEHILVMESLIGRYLVPGENVHHINGIKDDNRPENLELWCRPQPTGIRAEDAYKQALKTIELYSGLFSSPTNLDD